jgi:hypothetical protein
MPVRPRFTSGLVAPRQLYLIDLGAPQNFREMFLRQS